MVVAASRWRRYAYTCALTVSAFMSAADALRLFEITHDPRVAVDQGLAGSLGAVAISAANRNCSMPKKTTSTSKSAKDNLRGVVCFHERLPSPFGLPFVRIPVVRKN